MFYEVSKFLNFFLSPVTWVVLLLLGAFFWNRRRKLRMVCLWGAALVFLVFSNDLLTAYAKYKVAGKYAQSTMKEGKKYRTAIVMGGFGSMNRKTGQLRYYSDRAERLWEAVRMYKTGKVAYILITGDDTSCMLNNGSSAAELFLIYMDQMGIPKKAFLLEQKARNTRENSLYTTEILKKRGVSDKECLLITSATHMKRSLGCFAKAGFHPDYVAVNIYDSPAEINHRSFYPSWDSAVKWQEILNEWIGYQVYKMKDYV